MTLTIRVARDQSHVRKSGFRQRFFKGYDSSSPGSQSIDEHTGFCPTCASILSGTKEPIRTDVIYRFYEFHESAWQLRASFSQGCWICSTIWDHFSSIEQQRLMNLNIRLNTTFEVARYRDVTISWSTIDLSPSLQGKISLDSTVEAEVRYFDASISHTTDSAPCWEVASDWIRRCQEEHETCNSIRENIGWHPSRLIDIGPDARSNPRLVCTLDEPVTEPYLTLSHCWGSSEFLQLTERNIALFKEAIPVDALSKTFQDALVAARRLGIRYIWIDSLCIIQQQESREDWLHESPSMGRIYSNSLCNLSAVASSDGAGGLFRRRNPYTYFPAAFRIPESEAHLLLAQDWKSQLLDTPLMKRGWVVQERILTPRLLHFSRHQLLWECCELEASERFPNGHPSSSQFFRTTGSLAGFKRNLMLGVDLSAPVDTFRDAESPVYKLWNRVLGAYTRTELTYPEDKLIAIGGIAAKFQSVLGCEYLAGLWNGSRFPSQLLWRVLQPPTRQRPPQYRAPSFSWASVDGIIIPNDPYPYLEDSTSKVLIEVIEARVDCVNSNATGQTAGAFLILKGDLRILNDQTHFDRDFAFQRDEGKEYLFLPILQTPGNPTRFSGLVLECTLRSSNEYRRVGLARLTGPVWEQMAFYDHEDAIHASACNGLTAPKEKHIIRII